MLWKLLFVYVLSIFVILNERVLGDLDIKVVYIVFCELKKNNKENCRYS